MTYEDGVRDGRKLEQKSILTIIELDLLSQQAANPQELIQRLRQLIETRAWQQDTNQDSIET